MTLWQQAITIAMCILGTQITRWITFIVFSSEKPTPKYIQYLGKALPAAVFGMLVVYCFKGISIFSGTRGIPEAIAILAIVIVHLWKKKMLLSIAVGTVVYMLLVQGPLML